MDSYVQLKVDGKQQHLIHKRKRRTQVGLTQKRISPTLPFTKLLLKVSFNYQTLKIELLAME